MLVVCGSCRHGILATQPSQLVLNESFESDQCCHAGHLAQWRVDTSGDNSAVYSDVGETGKGVHLVGGGEGLEAQLVRTLDARPVRLRRIVVSARVRVHSEAATGRALLRISVARPARSPTAWDNAESDSPNTSTWTTISAVQDVADDSTSVQIQLLSRGDTDAWFDDVTVTSQPIPDLVARELSKEEVSRLEAMAMLVGYLRFFSPHDQSAHANWQAVEVAAVDRSLASTQPSQFEASLSWLARIVAPSAVVYHEGSSPFERGEQKPPGIDAHLTRWRRYGYRGEQFASFRDGLDDEDPATIRLVRSIPRKEIGNCQRLHLRSAIDVVAGSPKIELLLVPQAGFQPINEVSKESASISTELTSEVTEISFGIAVHKYGAFNLNELALSCDENRQVSKFSSKFAPEIDGTANELYHVEQSRCADRECIKIARQFDTTFEPARDQLDVPIGHGLRLRMPLALWTDGHRILDNSLGEPFQSAPYSPRDFSARIAAAIDVWLGPKWFYPYFSDTRIDWNSQLSRVLQHAAQANSVEQQEAAILELMGTLKDLHATVNRYGIDATLPLYFRKIEDQLIVSNAIPPYDKLVARGSHVIAIDDVPIKDVLNRTAERVSTTETFRDFAIASAVGVGHRGELVALRIRAPGANTDVDVVVPRVYGSILPRLREEHAKSGTEVGAGIYYIDLHTLQSEEWQKLIPGLMNARAVVFDLRGYLTDAAFDVLAYFMDRTAISPRLQVPIVTPNRDSSRYNETTWTISPRLPHISAKAFFLIDGRAASASETLLQIVKDAKLGTIVGERSGGTNGNPVVYPTIGRMTVRFTGMRVLSSSGFVVQGVGIEPDVVVHPTYKGLVAGKDEMLEETVRLIQHP